MSKRVLELILTNIAEPALIRSRGKRCYDYIRRFGLICGLRTLFRNSTGQQLTEVCIPQSKTPIIIRPHTSDLGAFEQVFVENAYGLPLQTIPQFIIDGGANVGYASVYFANRFPDAQIIAVEPELSNTDLLRQNTYMYPNISVIQAGLWHETTLLQIENPEDEKWNFRVRESDSEDGAVRSVTVTEILELAGADTIDILKLDIEGAEREVFSSNYDDWLGKVNVLIIELHDHYRPGCSASFYSAVSKYNFDVSHQGENVVLTKKAVEKAS